MKLKLLILWLNPCICRIRIVVLLGVYVIIFCCLAVFVYSDGSLLLATNLNQLLGNGQDVVCITRYIKIVC